MDSTTLNDLKKRAAIVRDETKRAANTAQRVGSLLYDLADRFGAELMKDNRELLQYESIDKFPTTGAEGIIYMDTTTGYLYRWDTTSRTYTQVGGNNSTGGTVKHCVVAEGVAGSEDTLNELASAENFDKYYILQAKYNKLYVCLFKTVRVGWSARRIYYWKEDDTHDALVGDWLTAGWQYYKNGGVMGTSTPEETTTYIDDTTGNIYAYNATEGIFSQINNDTVELDTTIYVDAIDRNKLTALASDLAIYKTAGAYTVVCTTGSGSDVTSTTYNLLVESSEGGKRIRQYLTNRDGYYYRIYENGRWGVWVERQYAYISDVETIIATTNKTYTIDLAKDCEQALDWNINGSISITSIRARNVCALDYFLGDDTPVSLELTLQDDGSYLWEGNIDVDDQTLITWVVTKADDGVAALGINYQ